MRAMRKPGQTPEIPGPRSQVKAEDQTLGGAGWHVRRTGAKRLGVSGAGKALERVFAGRQINTKKKSGFTPLHKNRKTWERTGGGLIWQRHGKAPGGEQICRKKIWHFARTTKRTLILGLLFSIGMQKNTNNVTPSQASDATTISKFCTFSRKGKVEGEGWVGGNPPGHR